jgi:hypothetical protein
MKTGEWSGIAVTQARSGFVQNGFPAGDGKMQMKINK